MKAVIQRVVSASVEVDGKTVSAIGSGLLVFLGISKQDAGFFNNDYLINKILKLRVFPDGQQDFHTSVVDVGGEILLISQFTLYGNCIKGNRPSFFEAMSPQEAIGQYDSFAKDLKKSYSKVKEGVFGADMQVSLINDGPVTIIIDGPTK